MCLRAGCTPRLKPCLDAWLRQNDSLVGTPTNRRRLMTSSESESNQPLEAPERLDYFMVRLARREGDPERVAGLVERLATGEKREFDTADQLVRLVVAWNSSDSNMDGVPE